MYDPSCPEIPVMSAVFIVSININTYINNFRVMENMGNLLDVLSADTLSLLIEKNLSLWEFVRADESCKNLLNLFILYRNNINLGSVSRESILRYVEKNRKDLYVLLMTTAGLEWMGWNVRELREGLENI